MPVADVATLGSGGACRRAGATDALGLRATISTRHGFHPDVQQLV